MTVDRRSISAPIDPSGLKFGPIWLTPGVTFINAWTLLLVAFFSIGLTSFINVFQPYILTEHLGIPRGSLLEPGEQGQVTALLSLTQEVIMLSLLIPIGMAADKIGRRTIFALGFFLLAVGFTLYPTATSLTQLIAFRFVYAIGAACVVAMLATTQADYPQDASRGKMIGLTGVLQGIGVVSAILLLNQLPLFYRDIAESPIWAGRFSLWTVAAICLFVALAARFGLKGGTPKEESKRESFVHLFGAGLKAGRNPRIALAYGAAMIARVYLVIVSNFFILWLVLSGVEPGLETDAAQGQAGLFAAFVQICAVMFAPLAGYMIDKVNRVTALCMAAGVAAVGYLSMGLVTEPLGPQMFIAGVFLGAGEISGIIASQALIGQEAPERERGSVFGFFGFCGAAGIMIALGVGGYLFDNVARTGPFLFMGCANILLLTIAIIVRINWGESKKVAAAHDAPAAPLAQGGEVTPVLTETAAAPSEAVTRESVPSNPKPS